MAIDKNSFHLTDSFILPSPRVFYPAEIPASHPQLRSLICLPTPNVLYYVKDVEIWRLDLLGRSRELLTRIPFAGRCVGAGHGWLCVGGPDHGQFAAIKIEDGPSTPSARSPQPYTDVDAPLFPHNDLEGRRSAQRLSVMPEHTSGSSHQPKPDVRPREFGGLTMNSVTIFQPPEGTDDSAAGPIAILTNNDKTVKLYSLPENRLLSTLDFPFPMNHASIRPDGEALVAVGDDAYVYFYRRLSPKARPLPKGTGSTNSASSAWRWDVVQRIELMRAPHSYDDAWFATAFSPCGRYCAVASQGGVVTIFDAESITDADCDPVIGSEISSRPYELSHEGAIRSICFSPAPWDLLICVEQSERVCVFDARRGFRLRQIVTTDARPGNVEKAQIRDDRGADELIDPRLRNTLLHWDYLRRYRDVLAAREQQVAGTDFGLNYIETPVIPSFLTTQDRGQQEPFTAREEHILEALRTSRQRMEERERIPSITDDRSIRREGGSGPATPALGASAAGSSTTNSAPVPTVRNHFRERSSDQDRSTGRPYDPRRRPSVIIAQGEPTRSGTARDLPEPTRTLSPPRMQTSAADPWRAIESYLGTSTQVAQEIGAALERHPNGEVTSRSAYAVTLQELERISRLRLGTTEHRRRERHRSLHMEVEAGDRYDTDSPHYDDGDFYASSTGCCMSADGKKLYVGTKYGVMEYSVNLQSRKQFPGITPR